MSVTLGGHGSQVPDSRPGTINGDDFKVIPYLHTFTWEVNSNNKGGATGTLKTPGSEIDSERVHWGQTPFRVNDDPEISQLDTECDPELGQSDPII